MKGEKLVLKFKQNKTKTKKLKFKNEEKNTKAKFCLRLLFDGSGQSVMVSSVQIYNSQVLVNCCFLQ